VFEVDPDRKFAPQNSQNETPSEFGLPQEEQFMNNLL
jgi:hypothetical protein